MAEKLQTMTYYRSQISEMSGFMKSGVAVGTDRD